MSSRRIQFLQSRRFILLYMLVVYFPTPKRFQRGSKSTNVSCITSDFDITYTTLGHLHAYTYVYVQK